MSCGSSGSGRFTKKRIVVFASLGAGIATASYFAFTLIDSRALVASSALLGIAACPLMCAAVGGVVWVRNRISRIKNKRIKIPVVSIITQKKIMKQNSLKISRSLKG